MTSYPVVTFSELAFGEGRCDPVMQIRANKCAVLDDSYDDNVAANGLAPMRSGFAGSTRMNSLRRHAH